MQRVVAQERQASPRVWRPGAPCHYFVAQRQQEQLREVEASESSPSAQAPGRQPAQERVKARAEGGASAHAGEAAAGLVHGPGEEEAG